jgi:hypothetical protein
MDVVLKRVRTSSQYIVVFLMSVASSILAETTRKRWATIPMT